MRKKELEQRINKLEVDNTFSKGLNTETAERVGKLEARFDNLDKLLDETILPYITSQLVKQLGEHIGEFANDLADLFESEKPKTAKNVKKDTEKPAKNVGKKTTKKKEGK